MILMTFFCFCCCLFLPKILATSTKEMAFEEKKKIFSKKKKSISDLSPKIPQDLHTYFEHILAGEHSGNFKFTQADPDQMLLDKEK